MAEFEPMITCISKSQRSAVNSVWQKKREFLLETVKPYRRACAMAAVALILAIVSINGFDDAGLLTSRSEAWALLFLILPMAFVFANDCDPVGAAFSLAQQFFFFLMSVFVTLNPIHSTTHISPALSVHLPPPRLAS